MRGGGGGGGLIFDASLRRRRQFQCCGSLMAVTIPESISLTSVCFRAVELTVEPLNVEITENVLAEDADIIFT